MSLHRSFSTGVLGLALSAIALPAVAGPEIASADRLLNTNAQGCLARTDRFISSLEIRSDRGSIDRTGYFEDGTFRILCYSTGSESMVVIFAAHDESVSVATSFVELALEELSRD